MNVKETVLKLFSNDFDTELKTDRLPAIISSTSSKMRELCGNELYAEYKKLGADSTVTEVSTYSTGIINVVIGTHSFVAGDYIYFTGDNQSYVGDCIVSSVTATSIRIYYSFDGITVPEDYPSTLPSIDDLYVTSAEKYDLTTAESFLVAYNLTVVLKAVRDETVFSDSSDFGEGKIYEVGFDSVKTKQREYLGEARRLVGKYLIDDDDNDSSLYVGCLSGSDTWQTS